MAKLDTRVLALGFATLMILVATMMRLGMIEGGEAVLTLLPILFVTTVLAARDRRSCLRGR